MWKMGEMCINRGKWEEMVGNGKNGGYGREWGGGVWGNSRHSTQDVGCGGLWWDVVEESGTKKEKIWTKYPFFTVPFSRFFRRLKIAPFLKTRTHQRKNGIFCHPPTLTITAAGADAWK